MSAEIDYGECQCCGAEPAVGVAAIPGVPMSITWGRECLRHQAIPLWVADAEVGQCCNPVDPTWDQMADWFREQTVPVEGKYVRIDSLALGSFDHEHTDKDAPYVDEHGSCPLCFEGKIAGLVTPIVDGRFGR